MNDVFHPAALAEYAAAVQYYAEQRREVAQAFITAVETAVDQMQAAPNRYPKISEDVRRCMTRQFPDGILYTIESDYILILAVMHCSRQPGYWQSRK